MSINRRFLPFILLFSVLVACHTETDIQSQEDWISHLSTLGLSPDANAFLLILAKEKEGIFFLDSLGLWKDIYRMEINPIGNDFLPYGTFNIKQLDSLSLEIEYPDSFYLKKIKSKGDFFAKSKVNPRMELKDNNLRFFPNILERKCLILPSRLDEYDRFKPERNEPHWMPEAHLRAKLIYKEIFHADK